MGWIPGPSGDIVHVGGGKGGTSSAGERNPQVGGGAGGVAVEIRTYFLVVIPYRLVSSPGAVSLWRYLTTI